MSDSDRANFSQVDEADLLAVIEGEAIAPERRAAIEAAVASNPKLARLVSGLKGDRATLRSLPEPTCPPGLIESVESVLERHMLVGISAVDDATPVQLKAPSHRGNRASWQIFTSDRTGRRLLAAASLLIVAGGVSYWAATQFQPRGLTPAGPGPVAIHDTKPAQGPGSSERPDPAAKVIAQAPPGTNPSTTTDPNATVDHSASTPEIAAARTQSNPNAGANSLRLPNATEVAAADHNPGAAPPILPGAITPSSGLGNLGGPVETLAHDNGRSPAQDSVGDISFDMAVELASAGRLAITVSGSSDEIEITNPSDRNEGWMIAAASDEEWSSTALNEFGKVHATGLQGSNSGSGETQMAMQGDPREPETLLVPMGTSGLLSSMPVQKATWNRSLTAGPTVVPAALRPNKQSLESLVESLRRGGATVQFEALEEPLGDFGMPLTPENVFWWSKSPSSWRTMTWVPIYIQRR